MDAAANLDELRERVIGCRACPRLVEWREEVARTKRAAFRDQEYWGRPVPGFGGAGAGARIFVVGLAPAAHGGNRTGRIFTGDRSGDWLFASLYRCGLANQPTSTALDDGLELRATYVSAAVKCAPPANKPLPEERRACVDRYLRDELALVAPQVVVALGKFAFDIASDLLGLRPRPRFGHAVEILAPGGPLLLGSFHPSQQNTFTGKLTEGMLDQVFARAAQLVGEV